MRFLTFTLALAASMAATAAVSVNVNELAQYVYPANRAASASLSFIPDGLSYLKITDEGRHIDRFNTADGKFVETVMDVANTRGDNRIKEIDSYEVVASGAKLLICTEPAAIYRHSQWATYYVYDIARRTLKPLSTVHTRQQAPVVSPDGRMVAFMAEDNNIYIAKLDYGTEVPVTDDGAVNAIINGVPDWTYQEEFTTYRSMEWAPDNTALSYLKYNEEAVPAVNIPIYPGACMETILTPDSSLFTYKYPVAGDPNSTVSLHSYEVDTRKAKHITLPDAAIEYIPRIHYGPTAEQLMVLTLNRDQNHFEIYAVNPKSTVVRSIYVDTSSAWIPTEAYEDVTYEPDGMVLFSSRTGWSHLYRYSYSGQLLATLTSGQYDVTGYYGTAPDGSYVVQSAEHGPQYRTLVRTDRKGKRTELTPATGWASATFAPAMNHYVVNYSTAAVPPVYTLRDAKDRTVRTLEDNAAYAARFASAPVKEFFTFTSDAGVQLNGWMIRPANFDASRRYPVVMYQYSGPGSQSVVDRWGMDWEPYYAMQGYVVACVDGRGTGGRGRDFEQVVYKNLGHYETIDQLAALKHMQSLPWVDAKRCGIFGWSYGGYETLMCASAAGAGYAAAVAVAPVTSWRFYDSIYTERYMTTPRQNPEGFDRSAPLSRTAALSCPLLMMSGTADDNVHVKNTMEYMASLEEQGRWADMLLFPNQNHSIYGCDTRKVVYARMLEFFNTHLR